LIAVLDSDLIDVKVIDCPTGNRRCPGELHGVTFDSRQYVFISGFYGVAKFSLDGDLMAVNRDSGIMSKIVYGYGYLYAFGIDEIEDYGRSVLYVHDTDLNIVERRVLSESIDTYSYLNIGKPAVEGNNIYVAGFDTTADHPNTRISLQYSSVSTSPL